MLTAVQGEAAAAPAAVAVKPEAAKRGADELDERKLFYRALQFLGFDSAAASRRLKIPVGEDMFASTNVKGMQLVVHFFLATIDPDGTYERFRPCWPIVTKKDQADFLTAAMQSIKLLEAAGVMPRGVARKSDVASASGPRFLSCLFYLSTAALEAEMKRSGLGAGASASAAAPVPVFTLEEKSSAAEIRRKLQAMQAHTTIQARQLEAHMRMAREQQHTWQSFADGMSRDLKAATAALEDVRAQQELIDEKDVAFTHEGALQRAQYLRTIEAAENSLHALVASAADDQSSTAC